MRSLNEVKGQGDPTWILLMTLQKRHLSGGGAAPSGINGLLEQPLSLTALNGYTQINHLGRGGGGGGGGGGGEISCGGDYYYLHCSVQGQLVNGSRQEEEGGYGEEEVGGPWAGGRSGRVWGRGAGICCV